jgi:hypothetical protein
MAKRDAIPAYGAIHGRVLLADRGHLLSRLRFPGEIIIGRSIRTPRGSDR